MKSRKGNLYFWIMGLMMFLVFTGFGIILGDIYNDSFINLFGNRYFTSL